MASLAIVGSWVNGQFIPDDEPNRTEKRWNDVVFDSESGEYYRLVEDGRTGRFNLWKVTADVVTSLFFSQVSPLVEVEL